MEVRYPKINFDDVPAIWGADLEYVCMTNANSTTLPILEPFLIIANTIALKQLDPVQDADLIREVEWFNAQEAQHYRQHIRFNKCFGNGRYPRLDELEKKWSMDFDRFIKEKPLAFSLAYAEGFESVGSVYYRAYFEYLPKYRIGARDEVVRMWDWHNAEEFEHKEVAFKIFKATCARGSLWKRLRYGWLYRIYGVYTAMTHIFGYVNELTEHMLFVEYQNRGYTPQQIKASQKHLKEIKKTLGKQMIWGLLGLLSPLYNPRRVKPPRGMDLILERFQPGGQYGPPLKTVPAE